MAKRITNRDLQEQLDVQKYCESERRGRDLSGFMDYCAKCSKASDKGCSATQEERSEKFLCAKVARK